MQVNAKYFPEHKPSRGSSSLPALAAANQRPGLIQEMRASGSRAPSRSAVGIRSLQRRHWGGGPGPDQPLPPATLRTGPSPVAARAQWEQAGHRNPGEKSSDPCHRRDLPMQPGAPPSSPSHLSEPLLLRMQSRFRVWSKLRAWKQWGSERKVHCPIFLVSVKDSLFIYI